MQQEKKPRLDIMLDLETLGVSAGSIILSVAMQTFSLDCSHAPKEELDYYQHISALDSLWHHLRSDEGTEEWWTKQSEAAKRKLMEGQKSAVGVEGVMRLVYEVLKGWNEKYDLFIWGRGVGAFDLPLLDSVMRKIIGDGYKTPWNYWSAMDVRTIVNFCRRCAMADLALDSPHDARGDVMKQIKEVQLCYQFIKIEKALD